MSPALIPKYQPAIATGMEMSKALTGSTFTKKTKGTIQRMANPKTMASRTQIERGYKLGNLSAWIPLPPVGCCIFAEFCLPTHHILSEIQIIEPFKNVIVSELANSHLGHHARRHEGS
jgi:hypothetical protein